MDQALKNWHKELFIREYEQNVINEMIVDIVGKYFAYRNITPAPDQQKYIVTFLIGELTKRSFPYAKPCMIAWAFRKYDDIRNNNISAGVLYEYIRLAYNNEEYKAICKKWLDSQDNLLPERSVEARNQEAMMHAWEECVESVRTNNINYNSGNWYLAYRHLAKILKYHPNEGLIKEFRSIAVSRIRIEKKTEIDRLTLTGYRSQAKAERDKLNIENFMDTDAVTMMTRKLLVENYIRTIHLKKHKAPNVNV